MNETETKKSPNNTSGAAESRDKKVSPGRKKRDKGYWELLVAAGFHVFRQFSDTYYAGFAAQIAYYFFMSSMPTMVVLSQLLGLFDISIDFIREWINNHVDEHMTGFIMGLLSPSSVRFTNLILVLVALWAASGFIFSLSRLTNHVLTEGQYRYGFFIERAKAIPTALTYLIAITFTLAIYIYGENMFRRFINKYFIFRILLALRLPIVIGLFFTLILFTYYFLPRIRVPMSAIVPGAIVATFGIVIVSTIYGMYIGYVADYNILYGSFANIVALMLWFYLIAWVMCLGAMFNKAWDEVAENGLLTKEKMVEYIEKHRRRVDDGEKLFVTEEDNFNPETEHISVKLSRKFVKGYEEQLKKEKQEYEERQKKQRILEDIYEDYMNE